MPSPQTATTTTTSTTPTHMGSGKRHRRLAPWMTEKGPPSAFALGSAHASPCWNAQRSERTPAGTSATWRSLVSPSRVHVYSARPDARSALAAATNACEKSTPTTMSKSRDKSNDVRPVAQPTSRAEERGTPSFVAHVVQSAAVLEGKRVRGRGGMRRGAEGKTHGAHR